MLLEQCFTIYMIRMGCKICEKLAIPMEMLPKVASSSEIYAQTDPSVFFGKEIDIAGAAGDQQAALFGQCCFDKGMAKNTYGTGCFMLIKYW